MTCSELPSLRHNLPLIVYLLGPLMRHRSFSPPLVILLAILLTLTLLEIGVRVWFSTRGTEQDRVRYLDAREQIADRDAELIGIPYLNYALNPARADVNARGYRGQDVAIPKPEGIFRIVALGGSTTYGHALTAVEAYPAQLQRLLRETSGDRIEVVNLGVPGYFSLDSLVHLATRGVALEPDVVVVYDGVNDAALRIFQSPDCTAGENPLFGMGLDRGIWTVDNAPLPPSALYRLIAIRLGWMRDPAVFDAQLMPTGLCPPEPQGVNPLDTLAANPPLLFERNLRGIAAMGRSAGAQVVFATFAWDRAALQAQVDATPEQYQAEALIRAIDEQNDLVRALAAELDVTLVDLAAEMSDGAYYQGDHVHMTAAGTGRQAALIAATIRAERLIPGG
jgi:lysophospholipase L1-like esterase